MEDSSVSAIYRSVIDTVIERVKAEFVQEGVDESVLDELRLKWEEKLKESGALEPIPAPAPVRYQQQRQQQLQSGRQMPPLPAFLRNLTAQQPTASSSYPAQHAANSVLSGSPAQYLQSRQPQAATKILAPHPVMSGLPLGTPAVSVPLPSDRLHPHLLSNTGAIPQQLQRQYQSSYSVPSAGPYRGPPQQQVQPAGASRSSTMPQMPLYQQQQRQQQPQAVQTGSAQGPAQQQEHIPQQQQQQQQQHRQHHSNGTGPNLPSLLSIHIPSSTAAPETRKRKADDDLSGLFSLLPDSSPSAPASAPPIIPQQDGPADDVDDDKEATDDETAEKDAEKGETFSDVSSEPEEDDDQQISNIVVGQFEKVQRSRGKWKVHLKDGVMRINGKDHLFHTAVGDMQF